jgi:hypothetical protein
LSFSLYLDDPFEFRLNLSCLFLDWCQQLDLGLKGAPAGFDLFLPTPGVSDRFHHVQQRRCQPQRFALGFF